MTWGHPDYGGDSSAVQKQLRNVQHIEASARAFAAVLGDGSGVTWGDRYSGGDSSAVQGPLLNVQHIQASVQAFAALLGDGSVVTCGHPDYGGDTVDDKNRALILRMPFPSPALNFNIA